MKRRAVVYRDEKYASRAFPWYWQHECRGAFELGGCVMRESGGFKTQRGAFMAAWLHVASCTGKREFPER